ncbi:MAG TPA: VWA domain-containing protein [Vicinamibacteria bacterium]
MRHALVLAGFVILVPLAQAPLALAQQPAESPDPPVVVQGLDRGPTFGSGLDLVNVTITVRDAAGRLVPNLGPEDFAIYEDGRLQKPEVFGSPAMYGGEVPIEDENYAINLGLLLDTSESMLKELRLSKEAATRFLENIPRAKDLLTIFFDQDIRISRYNSENQQGLYHRIMETKGSGNTALYDAIAVYLSRVAGTPGRSILVVLTDGEDTTSATTLSELIQLVRGSPVTIYPIAFAGSYSVGTSKAMSARAVLNQLAELTGGSVYAPAASRDLAAVYAAIISELKAQYVLGYVSDNAKSDGRFRRLKVELLSKALRVRHRQGYLVPRPPRPE